MADAVAYRYALMHYKNIKQADKMVFKQVHLTYIHSMASYDPTNF